MIEFATQFTPPYSFTQNNIVIERKLGSGEENGSTKFNLSTELYTLGFSQTQVSSPKINSLDNNNPSNIKKITSDEMIESLYAISEKMFKNSVSIDSDIQAVINKEFWNLL